MGFDSVCDTGLVLGLSLYSSPSSMVKLNTMSSTYLAEGVTETTACLEPSLTLGLSCNRRDEPANLNKKLMVAASGGDHLSALYRQDSTVISGGGSSFSNVSVKREREAVGSEESERASNDDNHSRVMSTTSFDDVEDDDGCVNGRKKLRLTKPQSAVLEEAFKLHSSLNPQKQKQELARELKLRPRQVEVWFQNRRARTKLKQTEMDFDHLKKCCEKLTDENRRLQKELHELKGLKSSKPFYMQLPPATLTMCPSCEMIGDSKSVAVKNPFSMAAQPHFYNSFTNPSTAC